jgi:hypothetical protein
VCRGRDRSVPGRGRVRAAGGGRRAFEIVGSFSSREAVSAARRFTGDVFVETRADVFVRQGLTAELSSRTFWSLRASSRHSRQQGPIDEQRL